MRKAWYQLTKSYEFINNLFCDIPFGKVYTFAAMPNMSKQDLEQKLDPDCMEMMLCKEDLESPEKLGKKLGLDTVKTSSESARKQLCTMVSRLLGPASGLHVPVREPAQIGSAEKDQLDMEVEKVDNDPWIILNKVQARGVEQALEDGVKLVAIEGPPGSGKTILGEEIARRSVKKVRKDMHEEPILFVCGNLRVLETFSFLSLAKHLQSNAIDMGGQYFDLRDLLRKKGLTK